MFVSIFNRYKIAYTGLSAGSWYLSIVILINRSGTMVIPFLTIYCTQKLHFTIAQAGVIMTMFGCGSIAGAFMGGKITDRFGFYYVQLGALISGGIFFMLLGFLKTFLPMCAGAFVLSLFNESFRPANSAAIASYSLPENRTRSYSLNRLAINLGWAFGGALGGFLASVNYHLLFWVDGCTNLMAALLLLLLLPARKIGGIKISETGPSTGSAYRDKQFLGFIALVLCFAVCFFQLFTIQPLFFKTQWLLNERSIGALMAFNGIIIALFEMVLIHHLENKKSPLFYITAGIFCASISYLLFNILPVSVATAFVIISVISFGEILALPFMNSFWLKRTSAHNRGQYAALYTMAWSGAQIISPALSSFIVAGAGFKVLWFTSSAICLFTSLIFGWMYLQSKKNEFTGLVNQ